ncbi:hypothetical protein [Rossellomorea sp. GCM10028870]|uniref:hypothetical protein n=1 Tax=Rossellomorea sp. GCM10028870 TaxID=3273426 RepID=UPI00366E4FF3
MDKYQHFYDGNTQGFNFPIEKFGMLISANDFLLVCTSFDSRNEGDVTKDVSSMMGKQVAELQRTLSMNLLKSQMATQTAQATVMMKEMQVSQPAPHPDQGHVLEVRG